MYVPCTLVIRLRVGRRYNGTFSRYLSHLSLLQEVFWRRYFGAVARAKQPPGATSARAMRMAWCTCRATLDRLVRCGYRRVTLRRNFI